MICCAWVTFCLDGIRAKIEWLVSFQALLNAFLRISKYAYLSQL
jgi:hypothetical protein